ncbi:MAG: hypothetical protein IPN23_00015 [Elusimicrobia bacterium]|nr:hypothetical protein [Elusimicrobiota bacterium]
MLILKIFAGFLQALNAKATPRAIAGGVALGALIGLSPTGGVQNILFPPVDFPVAGEQERVGGGGLGLWGVDVAARRPV